MQIPFNKPYMTGKKLGYIAQAHANGHLAEEWSFDHARRRGWLEQCTNDFSLVRGVL